ncbi:MAG: GNAT family N-acetyltransferase [Anaerolineae bacterium]|nr:GNAT family N-acetyltransferase [Anaerolineae bacterium]
MQFQKLTLERVETGLPAGYTARMARMDDIDIVVEMLNETEMAEIGEEMLSKEALLAEWESPDYGPETNIYLVFAPAGDLAGYAEIWCSTPYVRAFVFARTHPNYRGLGIGGYLLGWGEQCAVEEHMDKAPADALFTMRVMTASTNEFARKLFLEHGFDLVRSFYRMEIEMASDAPPQAAAWPDGIRVRTMVCGRDERPIYDAMQDAFRDHWGFIASDNFEQWVHWFTNDPSFDPSLNFLAVTDGPDGEEIAGMSLCRLFDTDPNKGWVNTLGVRRPWRRQGVATALLLHSFGEFYRRGKYMVGLGVDAGSLTGATRLYEKAGMHVARRQDAYEKTLRSGRNISTQALGD